MEEIIYSKYLDKEKADAESRYRSDLKTLAQHLKLDVKGELTNKIIKDQFKI